MIISIIAVLFTFGLVIFLHELGHFIVCRLAGIRVEAFSFGFGKELWGRTSGPTRYSIRAIPLGGYVKPAGENLDEVSGAPDEYFSKPWYTRLGVVFAGPVMNYLLAFVLFAGVILVVGVPKASDAPVIGDLTQGYPAAAAGLRPGDRITRVDGLPVASWTQLADIIHAKPEKKIRLEYERAGVPSSADLLTRLAPTGPAWGVIGIAPGVEYARVPFLKGIAMGAHQCWYWTAFTVKTLASNIYRREKPDLAGPIGIVTIVSKAAHSGVADFFFLLGLISVAVGFFNLLPIPMLDGGWAVLYFYEGLFRRKLTLDLMKYVNAVGMVLLMGILLFATYNDIARIFSARAAKKAAAAQAQEK